MQTTQPMCTPPTTNFSNYSSTICIRNQLLFKAIDLKFPNAPARGQQHKKQVCRRRSENSGNNHQQHSQVDPISDIPHSNGKTAKCIAASHGIATMSNHTHSRKPFSFAEDQCKSPPLLKAKRSPAPCLD